MDNIDRDKLKSLLDQFYQDCYDSAVRIFQGLTPEAVTILCIMKIHEWEKAKAEYDQKQDSLTEEELLDSLLDAEATKAFITAAKSVTDVVMGNTPATIN